MPYCRFVSRLFFSCGKTFFCRSLVAAAFSIFAVVCTAAENNTWWGEVNPDSDTVFVFVHGVLSNSEDAWLYKNENDPSRNVFWPDLVKQDSTFGNPSVYLGGYYTAVDSGSYTTRDAANTLWTHLINKDANHGSVMDRKNIVFVAHSLGGIVVRQILVQHQRDFKNKAVGLVLVASPSLGSNDANRLNVLIELSNNKIGEQLQKENDYLVNLDKDFKNLAFKKGVPEDNFQLEGVELLENHYVIKTWGLFSNDKVVDASSGGRYFSEPHMIGNSDHISISKPNNIEHESHVALRNFYNNEFKSAKDRVLNNVLKYKFTSRHEYFMENGKIYVTKHGDNNVFSEASFNEEKYGTAGPYEASLNINGISVGNARPFTLETGQISPVVVRFDENFMIDGKIVDGEGKPKSGVSVKIDGEPKYISTDDGRFYVDNLPPQRSYRIDLTLDGETKSATIVNREWKFEITWSFPWQENRPNQAAVARNFKIVGI